MAHKLTIIMPCYNSSSTILEAITSIYTQNLAIPYEVIIVDDGSTDGTRDLITKLALAYPNIRYVFHEKNQGGGAARNTAVAHSDGDLIFCLDSDDILPPDTLPKMVTYLDEKQCDGVGIQTSIKFKGRNIKDVAYVTEFDYVGQKIPFEAWTDSSRCSLFSTFLLTRQAFHIVGGYPAEHGFDTQGLAFRFLANGLVAYTCPGAVYLHRVRFHKSYYVREYEAGKVSYNWFKILEEFLFLFNDRLKKELLSFDIYGETSHQNTIMDIIRRNQGDLYIQGYIDFVRPGILREAKAHLINHLDQCTPYDFYWLGLTEQKDGNYNLAADYFKEAILSDVESIHAYKQLVRSLCMATGANCQDIFNQISVEGFTTNRFSPSIVSRIRRKVSDTISKVKPCRRNLMLWKLKGAAKLNSSSIKPSQLPIDVVIPAIEKDVEVLPYVIQGIRKNVKHPLDDIMIISPESDKIRAVCAQQNCRFVLEDTLLPIKKSDIDYKVDGLDRSGWLFQQFLKLSGDLLGEQAHYLVVDADTVLISPQTFERNGKIIFNVSNEYHRPYWIAYEQILAEKPQLPLSFTSHQMLFDKAKLRELKQAIEVKNTCSWYEGIIQNLDKTEISGHSDYETYGQYMYAHHRSQMILEYWSNLSVKRHNLKDLQQLECQLKATYKSISFHAWNT